MATLSGEYFLDASGNRLLDASANTLTQDGVQVVILDGGFLASAAAAAGGSVWTVIIEWLLENLGPMFAAEIVEHLFGGGTTLDLNDYLPEIRTNARRLIPDTGTIAQLLENVNGDTDWIRGQFPITATVEFPSTPPTWYTPPESLDYDQMAGSFWGYTLSMPDMLGVDAGPMAQTVLVNAAMALQWRDGYEGVLLPDNPHFRFIAKDSYYTALWLGDWTSTELQSTVPQLDLSQVQTGDSVYSFLAREYPGYAWTRAAPNGHATGGRVYISMSGGDAYMVCSLTDADIAAAWPSPPVNVTVNIPTPPIVDPETYTQTFGDVITFDQPFVHNGACDGLVYTIETVGRGVKAYAVGSYTALTGAGVVSFFGADGRPERFQYINWDHGVIVPLTMPHASGFIFSSNVVLEGTVTPFTLTPVEG